MSTGSSAHEVEQFRHWITDIQISPDNSNPNCKFSAKLFVDDELACTLPWTEHPQPLRWSGLLLCNVSPASELSLRLCRSIRDRPRYFNFPAVNLSDVDRETGELIQELPDAVWVATTTCMTLELAAQLFPDKLDAFNRAEHTHDDLASDETETQTMKDHFKCAMRFARAIAEACPESQAKLSFLIYMKAWEMLDKQTHIDDTVKDILHGLIRIRDVVDIIGQASNSMIATAMNQSKELIQDMLALLEDISVYVLNRCGANDLAEIPREEEPDEASYTEAQLARLEGLQRQFYALSSLWSTSSTPRADAVNLGEGSNTSSQEIQSVIDESTRMADLDRILSYLKPVDPSGYNPDQACMDGTREAILNRILTWTQNRENGESIMWISGQPGTGKTAIATSLCQRLDSVQALAGSFFCQRGDSNLSTPLKVVNNLVCDIAMSCPAYAHEVAKAIRKAPKLHNAHLSLRFEGLVKKPLERLKSLAIPMTLVVVIDALDECGDRKSRNHLLQQLYAMSRLVPWLKLIFTGRPIGDMQAYFQDHCPRGTKIQMYDNDSSSDIRAYLQAQLGPLARIEHWPHDTIGNLCDMAEGVFLWAVMATQYISKYPLPALSRLRRLLDSHQSPVSDHFDQLYTHTLEAIIDDDNEETKDAYLRCISVILVTSKQGLIVTSDMQGFLLVAAGVHQTVFNRIVSDFGPLLSAKDGQPTSFYHSSFVDYLTNPSRSGKFHIQVDQYNAECAEFCFRVMQRDLKFNICGLQTSHIRNSEVPGLGVRVQSHIGPALRYACTHWPDHFATSPNPGLVASVKELFEGPQLMYWIEVLSLLGRIDVAMEQLPKLISLELNLDQWDVVVSWAKDLHRFLLSFHDAISTSTPHLYISALAFSPRQSSTAQRMQAFFPNIIKVAKGDTTWHSCIRPTLHPQAVRSLSVSPDGLTHIAGYSDGSVRIWNNHTGECTSESLVGHADSVTCVAYSPDGNLIATSSHDTTIRVWDPTEGLKTSRTLSGHSGSINCVAFSPNNAVIASGSSDNTIRLWDSQALSPIGEPYVGHSSRVSSLSFSPDGSKLASGSWDKTIRVWSVDLAGSRLCGSPLVITGHSDSITCVAFSPEGSKIVSGSIDRTVRAWNAQTGGKDGIRAFSMKHSDTISAIAYSLDGQTIASSSLDGAIMIWNATTYTSLGSFGHLSPVHTIDFVPNSAYLISGATDSTTRVWDITALTPSSSMTVGPITGHSSAVLSATISIDGSCIISGSADQAVRVWDAQTGSPIGQPFVGHSGNVNCVAISSDATRIYSCSHDKTMKVWDTTTCAAIHSHQHTAVIQCLALSPSCDLIAFGSDDHRVYLWDPIEWKMIGNALQGHTHQVLSVAFSPDGVLLASAGHDKNILLWDVKTRNQQGAPLSGHTSGVTSVAFSPCSTRLVSGSHDNTARLWDIKSGNVIRVLSGHSGYVMTAAFSLDGSRIASGSNDKTVRVWKAETGEMIGQPLSGHSGYIQSVVFSRDGKYVISGSDDKTIRVWGLDAPESTPEPANDSDSPGGSRWPANPYDLSCRPFSGWAVDSQQSLLFWLPAHYEQSHQFLGSPGQVVRSQPWLDYSSFVHGTAWTRVVRDPVG